MECHDVRSLLILHRREPDQFDAPELEALERHIDQCAACQSWNRSDNQFDAAVSSAMHEVPVPAGLEDRILKRVAVEAPPRRWGPIAAAACLLCAVGLATYFAWPGPVAVDVDDVVVSIDYRREGVTPETVQDHFASLGHRMIAPVEFHYGYLADFELAVFQGRTVPRLTFRRGTVQAQVYVLSEERFSISEASQGITRGDHHLVRVSSNSGFHYLVVVTGGPESRLWQQTI